MKAGALIERLQKFDPEMRVVVGIERYIRANHPADDRYVCVMVDAEDVEVEQLEARSDGTYGDPPRTHSAATGDYIVIGNDHAA